MECESNLMLSYEKQKLDQGMKKYVLPVCIVTGPLGVGKSTLVKHILEHRRNLKIGVVVNDVCMDFNMDQEVLSRFDFSIT